VSSWSLYVTVGMMSCQRTSIKMHEAFFICRSPGGAVPVALSRRRCATMAPELCMKRCENTIPSSCCPSDTGWRQCGWRKTNNPAYESGYAYLSIDVFESLTNDCVTTKQQRGLGCQSATFTNPRKLRFHFDPATPASPPLCLSTRQPHLFTTKRPLSRPSLTPG
jgi:hypothetical protein